MVQGSRLEVAVQQVQCRASKQNAASDTPGSVHCTVSGNTVWQYNQVEKLLHGRETNEIWVKVSG